MQSQILIVTHYSCLLYLFAVKTSGSKRNFAYTPPRCTMRSPHSASSKEDHLRLSGARRVQRPVTSRVSHAVALNATRGEQDVNRRRCFQHAA